MTRSKTWTDQGLVPTRPILVSTRAFAVTRGYLLGQASLILDPSQMIVTGTGWTGLAVANRARTLRNQDLRDSLWRITLWYIGAPCLVRRRPIVGTSGRELPAAIVDLIQKELDLRRIAGILIVERVRHDQTTVGIHRQMQLAAATPGLHAVFLFKLVARAKHFHAGTVDQHVKRARGHRSRLIAGRFCPRRLNVV